MDSISPLEMVSSALDHRIQAIWPRRYAPKLEAENADAKVRHGSYFFSAPIWKGCFEMSENSPCSHLIVLKSESEKEHDSTLAGHA